MPTRKNKTPDLFDDLPEAVAPKRESVQKPSSGGAGKSKAEKPPVSKNESCTESPEPSGADRPVIRYLTVKAVAARYGVNVSTVWYWGKKLPDFPKPIKLSSGTTRWSVEELDGYDAMKMAERDAEGCT